MTFFQLFSLYHWTKPPLRSILTLLCAYIFTISAHSSVFASTEADTRNTLATGKVVREIGLAKNDSITEAQVVEKVNNSTTKTEVFEQIKVKSAVSTEAAEETRADSADIKHAEEAGVDSGALRHAEDTKKATSSTEGATLEEQSVAIEYADASSLDWGAIQSKELNDISKHGKLETTKYPNDGIVDALLAIDSATGKSTEVERGHSSYQLAVNTPSKQVVDDSSRVRKSAADSTSTHKANLPVTADDKDAKHQADLQQLMQENATLKVELEQNKAELSAANAELDLIRNGLGELLEKLQQSEENSAILQTKLAGMIDLQVSDDAKLARRSLQEWQNLSNQGKELYAKVLKYCSVIDSLVEHLALSEVQQAELKLASDALRSELAKFSVATQGRDNENNLENIRVFAVYPDVGVAILPIGINHGVSMV